MKFAVMISGNGSNLQAVIDAIKSGEITADLSLVASNKEKAYGLTRAKEAGIPTLFLDPKTFTNKQSFDRQLAITLKEAKVNLIVLAGYMRMLTPFFVKQFDQQIINVHPSLLPAFKGKQGIKDAMTYGAKVTGATVHFVDEMMDHGPIIIQEAVKIQEHDTLETLEEKIHKIEHRILPKAIQLYAQGRLKIIRRRRVEISEK
jgi:phosphoribosylglycinamide formyltransferase-1